MRAIELDLEGVVLSDGLIADGLIAAAAFAPASAAFAPAPEPVATAATPNGGRLPEGSAIAATAKPAASNRGLHKPLAGRRHAVPCDRRLQGSQLRRLL